MKFTDDPGACRLSFERVLDAIFLRSSAGINALGADGAVYSLLGESVDEENSR
jgi:hypothetical protein